MANDFTDIETRKEVWDKGNPIDGYDPDIIRKDAAGAWMIFDRFGQDDPFGWDIDYIYPIKLLKENNVDSALWGNMQNLRPMNYANKQSKGNSYPDYSIRMKSEGDSNIECNESFTVNQELQESLKQLFCLI